MTTISIHTIKTNGPAAPGKLADAEIHFRGGELDGLKLVDVAVWNRRDGQGQNVSVPSRHFTFQGDRRSYSLRRWTGTRDTQQRLDAAVRHACRSTNSNWTGGLPDPTHMEATR